MLKSVSVKVLVRVKVQGLKGRDFSEDTWGNATRDLLRLFLELRILEYSWIETWWSLCSLHPKPLHLVCGPKGPLLLLWRYKAGHLSLFPTIPDHVFPVGSFGAAGDVGWQCQLPLWQESSTTAIMSSLQSGNSVASESLCHIGLWVQSIILSSFITQIAHGLSCFFSNKDS